jgi:uncharacterized SAM-binding protein YcdF (DUF218 family)
MARLLDELISPGGALMVLFTGALWAVRRPRSALAWRAILGAAILYLLGATYAVPATLTGLWASGYRQFEASDVAGRPTAVVLLGGDAEQLVPKADHLPRAPTPRVLEAWRVYNLIAPQWIVSSGGSWNGGLPAPGSILMRDALVKLGVPASRILLESTSFDTHDEAVLVAPMLRSLGIEQIVLVTSAIHMRRSLGTFRAAGLTVVPAIAPDRKSLRGGWNDRFLPSRHGLELSSRLAHEVVGLPYYWSRGWWRR